MFNVGDKVRARYPNELARPGEVVEVDAKAIGVHGFLPYKVKIEGAGTHWFRENEISLVEKVSLMLKEGDKVVVKETESERPAKPGVIIMVDMNDTSLPYLVQHDEDGSTEWYRANETALITDTSKLEVVTQKLDAVIAHLKDQLAREVNGRPVNKPRVAELQHTLKLAGVTANVREVKTMEIDYI